MGSKYDPIEIWLKGNVPETIEITISELGRLLEIDFPDYVHKYQWGNDKTQNLARSHMYAGYLVSQPNKDKEFLCFKYDPARCEELLKGKTSHMHRVVRSHRQDVPKPTPKEVEKYIDLWNMQENYTAQEKALDKLFFSVYPQNKLMEDILIKVSCLNDFYSTNIYSPFIVAKHIQALDIDGRLKQGDASLVEDIATVKMPNGRIINFYSFATKYCSHHQPDKFAIWDSYVDVVLRYFRDVDGFTTFENRDLKRYGSFKKVLTDFAEFYQLQQYCSNII